MLSTVLSTEHRLSLSILNPNPIESIILLLIYPFYRPRTFKVRKLVTGGDKVQILACLVSWHCWLRIF